MARSTDGAQVVLDCLRLLHTAGSRLDPPAGAVIEEFERLGVHGFSRDHEQALLMTGLVLRLLLRHADADPNSMFDATRRDIAALGRDIDDEKFEQIAHRFGDEP